MIVTGIIIMRASVYYVLPQPCGSPTGHLLGPWGCGLPCADKVMETQRGEDISKDHRASQCLLGHGRASSVAQGKGSEWLFRVP